MSCVKAHVLISYLIHSCRGPVDASGHRPLFEKTLWELFQCLARGVAVLDHGNERFEGPGVIPARPYPVVAFDIKPENGKSLDWYLSACSTTDLVAKSSWGTKTYTHIHARTIRFLPLW